MSIAEQLRIQGRKEGLEEGREEGLWMGEIRLLQKLLGKPQSSPKALEALTLEELEELQQSLNLKYETRFKRP